MSVTEQPIGFNVIGYCWLCSLCFCDVDQCHQSLSPVHKSGL